MTEDLHKLRLTKDPGDADERQYDLYPIQSGDSRQRKEAFSIAPPGLPAGRNIFLGVSGMNDDLTIRFTLWDDGTDRSNGTAPTTATIGVDASGNDITYDFNGTVQTVEEQELYLKHVIHAPDFAVTWSLDQLTGSRFNGDQVYVESVEPTMFDSDSPKWKECRLTLRRGGSV